MEQLAQLFNGFSVADGLMLIVTVALFISLFALQRQIKQQKEQQLSIESLKSDLRALTNAAVGVGGRVLDIERQQRKAPAVVTTAAPQPQQTAPSYSKPVAVDYTPPSSSNQPYEQAIYMAQTGATTDDIVNICGLSKSEAELISMMHRLDKAS